VRQRQYDVTLTVSCITIRCGCEKSQCSLYICYFISIWL